MWQMARSLTKKVHQASGQAKFLRDYALRDQIRRAAISVMSNIAEGFERGGDKEFIQFLSLAKGSCGEVRSQLYVALDQLYIDEAQFQVLSAETFRISGGISALMKYPRQSEMRGSKFKQAQASDS